MTEHMTERTIAPTLPNNELAPHSRSRIGAVWVSLAVFVTILLLLMIFVIQNSISIPINYFGAHSKISFGVAILLAAIAGSALTLLIGTARILQLKFMRKKNFGEDLN